MKIYFAHPVTDYGSERQAEALSSLQKYYREQWPRTNLEIENPDHPHHQEGYNREGMDYFKKIVESCDRLAFMRFPDGSIGAGVGREIRWGLQSCYAVYELFDGWLYQVQNMPTPILTVDQTRSKIAGIRASRYGDEPVCWLHETKCGAVEFAEKHDRDVISFPVYRIAKGMVQP